MVLRFAERLLALKIFQHAVLILRFFNLTKLIKILEWCKKKKNSQYQGSVAQIFSLQEYFLTHNTVT